MSELTRSGDHHHELAGSGSTFASSIKKPGEASARASPFSKLAMALPTLNVSAPSTLLGLQRSHPRSNTSMDPLIRAVGEHKYDESNDISHNEAKASISPTSNAPSYLKRLQVSTPTALTPPTTKDPFDAIYNNPGSWSQGAFVTAAQKRKKARRCKRWLFVLLGILLLLGASLTIFFCYPRAPCKHSDWAAPKRSWSFCRLFRLTLTYMRTNSDQGDFNSKQHE